jgi:hypothetical protein
MVEDIFNQQATVNNHQFHPVKFCLWQPSFGGFNRASNKPEAYKSTIINQMGV